MSVSLQTIIQATFYQLQYEVKVVSLKTYIDGRHQVLKILLLGLLKIYLNISAALKISVLCNSSVHIKTTKLFFHFIIVWFIHSC